MAVASSLQNDRLQDDPALHTARPFSIRLLTIILYLQKCPVIP